MTYCERIKDLRIDNDLTQAAIAASLNIAQTTYSDYENGSVRVPIDVLIALAKLYNVDMNYITGVSDKKMRFPG